MTEREKHAQAGNRIMRALKPCGTAAAYRRHQRHGEEPCDDCRAAHNRSCRVQGEPAEPAEPRPHGTLPAYRRHQRDGEKPCRACLDAYNDYQRGRDRYGHVVTCGGLVLAGLCHCRLRRDHDYEEGRPTKGAWAALCRRG